MTGKLKPGAIEVREDHEPMAPISGPWYSAASERQSLHKEEAEADAAQLNAALAVVERADACAKEIHAAVRRGELLPGVANDILNALGAPTDAMNSAPFKTDLYRPKESP